MNSNVHTLVHTSEYMLDVPRLGTERPKDRFNLMQNVISLCYFHGLCGVRTSAHSYIPG